jgi:hypothetical protein
MFGRVRFDNKSNTANLTRIVRTYDAEIGAFGWVTGAADRGANCPTSCIPNDENIILNPRYVDRIWRKFRQFCALEFAGRPSERARAEVRARRQPRPTDDRCRPLPHYVSSTGDVLNPPGLSRSDVMASGYDEESGDSLLLSRSTPMRKRTRARLHAAPGFGGVKDQASRLAGSA